MINRETKLTIADNSGARKALCIGFFKCIKTKNVTQNELIRVTIKEVNRRKFLSQKGKKKRKQAADRTKKSPKKGNLVYRAIVLTTTKEVKRHDGFSVKTKQNRITILSKD